MKLSIRLIIFFVGVVTFLAPLPALAQGVWTPLTNQPNIARPTQVQLLTDGSVLVEGYTAGGFPHPGVPLINVAWKLIPDINGSYTNGTWVEVAHPLYPHYQYPAYVLGDGRMFICGGVSNTPYNKSEIYDPVANVWTDVPAPTGWAYIGSTVGMVLANGRFIVKQVDGDLSAIYDPVSASWTPGPNLIFENSGLDTWALLPNNQIMSVEGYYAPGCELYDFGSNSWVAANSTPEALYNDNFNAGRIGASILLPTGKLFQIGATPYSCLYDLASGQWSNGPTLPSINGFPGSAGGGPAAVLPNGNVLMEISNITGPGSQSKGVTFEYDGVGFNQVPSPGSVPHGEGPYACNYLVLPSGEVLFDDGSGAADQQGNKVFVYTPTGSYQPSWQPTISSVATVLPQGGVNNVLAGTQLNGLTQGVGDGYTQTTATNYPLVRIQNNATGHVFYCKTHDHSTMGVATGSTPVSTQFDVPVAAELGPSKLYVVANGIPSASQSVTVIPQHVVLPSSYSLFRGTLVGGTLSSLFLADSNTLGVNPGLTLNSGEAPVQIVVNGSSPTLTPSSFQLTVIGKANTVGLNQKISLFNYSTNAYDVLDSRAATTSNQTVTVNASGSLSRYVGPGGAIKARIAYSQTGPTSLFPWRTDDDLVNWTIQ